MLFYTFLIKGGFYKFALLDFGIILEVNRLLTTVKSRRARGEPQSLPDILVLSQHVRAAFQENTDGHSTWLSCEDMPDRSLLIPADGNVEMIL